MVGQYIEGYEISINDRVCIHPDHCGDVTEVGCANSYWCPVGFRPGYAEVLLTYEDFVHIQAYSGYRMTFVWNRQVAHISDLILLEAKAVSKGAITASTVMLCRFADVRQLLVGKSIAGDVYANIFMPTLAGLGYVLDTTVNGTPLSWAGLLAAVWPSALGGFPLLPSSVDAIPVPESIVLSGDSLIDVLESIFQVLGLILVYNPWVPQIAILSQGELINDFPDDIPLWDGFPQYPALGKRAWLPAAIVTKFFIKSLYPGSEFDAEQKHNWIQDSIYSVTTLVGGPNGTMTTWGAAHGKRDDRSNIVNAAQLNAEGDRIAANLAVALKVDPYHRIYAGFHSFIPDTACKAIRVGRCKGTTVFTEVIAHVGPPMQYQGTDKMKMPDCTLLSGCDGKKFPPLPQYPRETQIVVPRAESPSEPLVRSHETTAGIRVYRGELAYYPQGLAEGAGSPGGFVYIMIAGTVPDREAPALASGTPMLGRRVGVATVAGQASSELNDTRPLYMCDSPVLAHFVDGYQCIKPGEMGEVHPVNEPPGETLSIKNTSMAEIHEHMKFWIIWDANERQWVPLADMDRDRVVLCLGSPSGGIYDGELQECVSSGGATTQWNSLCPVKVFGLNGEQLEDQKRYHGRIVQRIDDPPGLPMVAVNVGGESKSHQLLASLVNDMTSDGEQDITNVRYRDSGEAPTNPPTTAGNSWNLRAAAGATVLLTPESGLFGDSYVIDMVRAVSVRPTTDQQASGFELRGTRHEGVFFSAEVPVPLVPWATGEEC